VSERPEGAEAVGIRRKREKRAILSHVPTLLTMAIYKSNQNISLSCEAPMSEETRPMSQKLLVGYKPKKFILGL